MSVGDQFAFAGRQRTAKAVRLVGDPGGEFGLQFEESVPGLVQEGREVGALVQGNGQRVGGETSAGGSGILRE
jgi:hypothetical protein